jgi:hypothetical protein
MPRTTKPDPLLVLISQCCDETELRTLQRALGPAEAIEIERQYPTRDAESGEAAVATERQTVPLRNADLQWGKTPEQSFDLGDLKHIANVAIELEQYLKKLGRTPLVQRLLEVGELHPGDLLMGSPVFELTSGKFAGLRKLPTFAKEASSLSRTLQQDRALLTLCKYVKERTGKWNGRLLLELIQPFNLFEAQNRTEAFRVWRHRRRLVDRSRKRYISR